MATLRGRGHASLRTVWLRLRAISRHSMPGEPGHLAPWHRHVVTTAGISAGIDGSLHVVARLLGRRVADQVAMYMEYAWSPEPSLAMEYSYLNPSADARGKLMQNGDLQFEGRNYVEAEKTYRAILDQDATNREGWSSLAQTLRMQGKHAAAADAFVRSVEGSKGHMTGYGYYDAAAEFARAGQKEQAIKMLGKAFDSGYPNRSGVEKDPNLASIAAEPRVRQMLAAK